MDVTIVGAGNMARGLGARFLAGGHAVTVASRSAERAESAVAELASGPRARSADVRVGTPGRVQGDILVLAVPYPATLAVMASLGSSVEGRVVVDISNPVDWNRMERSIPADTSAAEQLAAVSAGARVVKAFNTVFSPTLARGVAGDVAVDVFVAGDNVDAKDMVGALVRDGGMRALDVGPLVRARELEALGYLGIMMQEPLGLGFRSGWKLVS